MSILASYRARFVEGLSRALDLPGAEIEKLVKPADPQHGDFSFGTFVAAKAKGKKPPEVAVELAKSLSLEGLEIAPAGPYVNARIAAMPFSREVIDQAYAQQERYGHGTSGTGKTVTIDYSSPNIAKPIAFHHIRSTVIGHSIANLYRSQGWKVEGINYLGDWGKQFGLVAVGFQEWGDPKRINDVAHLVDVYVKANERAEKEPAFDERAREFFRRMEANEPEAMKLWQQFRETSLSDFKLIYARLGIEFEHYEGESRYQGKMDAVIDRVTATVGTKVSEGALIVDLPYAENEPPVLLKKNDGSTLYATRDLAAAIDRQERFKFDRSLYVVATDQSLHFRQFFGVLAKMGLPWADRLVHVNFGRVKGMSTRKGNLKLLSEVLDEAHSRALTKVKDNIAAGRIETDDPAKLAEEIGLGAIVFGDLKNRRTTDYEFDWDQVLDFEGHTGPYLQYAHARACTVLQRGGGVPASYDASLLVLPEERALLRQIATLPVVFQDALAQNEPSLVARHLLEIAAAFSRWYTLGNQQREHRVLVEGQPALQAARLALTNASAIALRAGLGILGIGAPQQM
ncbi:MAG: arginine--tRNA ligase [Myxococcaceae bacterium]|nr:arginine--tRNA ligase [Myxococcaceae bacterium]